MNSNTSNNNNTNSTASATRLTSNSNNSVSRSIQIEGLKRQLDTEKLIWDKLYNDLLNSVLEYCNQLTLTQIVMLINRYWNTVAKSSRVWNNRLIQLSKPASLDEFDLFISTHPYLISVSNWYWYSSKYDRLNNHLILKSQSTAFNQLKSIKFFLCSLSKSDMIILCTSFNLLISLSFSNCNMDDSVLIQLNLKQYILTDNNSMQTTTIKPNRLLNQLKQLNLGPSISPIDYDRYNFLYNLIKLESLTIINFRINQLFDLRFYSIIANRMPKLIYLNTNECKQIEFEEIELAAISQLIQRLNTCLIKKPFYLHLDSFNSKVWIRIFQSAVINNTSPLQHIRLPYSYELIDYLVQFPALNSLYIELINLKSQDLKSLSALSELTELNILSYRYSDSIFTELKSLTKLKILYLGKVDGNYSVIKYFQFRELFIELSKSNSLIELHISIHILNEFPINQKTISIRLIEFMDLLEKSKLKFLSISNSTLEYFYPVSAAAGLGNSQTDNNQLEWHKELNSKLSKLLSNTIVRID